MGMNENNKVSVVDMVLDGIISDIIEGRLNPGDKIPTEPELCKRFGAGRNSVREAIKKLEANGILYIKRADGTFVSENYNHKMLDPMLYSIILKKNSWHDFVDLRFVIDIGTLQYIINEINKDEKFNDVRKVLLQMEAELCEENPDIDALLELDRKFHSILVEKANNPQLITITDYITRLTLPSRRATIEKIISDGQTDEFISLHRQMLEVVEKKEADKVVETVMNHYKYWK
ncbi:DNA-binding transcriptional regulator, FadR family [Pseudobutyrivibrio sp. C4]|jgi:DNA-binding FadR family transcriptional regulator|uniref:FadR/GntR family transcriptional regulator n=1 Tax=Pseudobutyrivibrio sp. C4 TaxID=1520803 RepID=UPI0008D54FFB|nr:GntR family transcriptional regulator [Pseudobutyrivibrio sp. C4]SES78307.1 DNA-binding transcriptional regulator, FadR family [Pseudobutyrivibrio sp. C4]